MKSEKHKLAKGYVQIYTGNGKGKTTAALGLTLRACGAGLSVFFGQFMKAGCFSETAALKRLSRNVKLEQYGTGRFVRGKPSAGDIAAANRGLHRIASAMASGKYDLVIADEALTSASAGVIEQRQLLALIRAKPADVELVLTGRGATRALIAAADLATDMKQVKHYFTRDVAARKGIEF